MSRQSTLAASKGQMLIVANLFLFLLMMMSFTSLRYMMVFILEKIYSSMGYRDWMLFLMSIVSKSHYQQDNRHNGSVHESGGRPLEKHG